MFCRWQVKKKNEKLNVAFESIALNLQFFWCIVGVLQIHLNYAYFSVEINAYEMKTTQHSNRMCRTIAYGISTDYSSINISDRFDLDNELITHTQTHVHLSNVHTYTTFSPKYVKFNDSISIKLLFSQRNEPIISFEWLKTLSKSSFNILHLNTESFIFDKLTQYQDVKRNLR